MIRSPRTWVYVDGFNLYYGCLRNSSFRWLDLSLFCRNLLPRNRVERVKYFTAMVSGRPNDPGKPARQEQYLRALRTLPDVEVYKGTFRTGIRRMRLASPPPSGPRTVDVIYVEEKGSDVNLAVQLVNDAHRSRFEVGVIISNDADLAGAARIVREELGLVVGVVNPHPGRASMELMKHASFMKAVRPSTLRRSQFAPELNDSGGRFSKPPQW